jgi:hypothetical protein
MDAKHDVAPDEMMPQTEKSPKADEMEQAQKEAAEERAQGGGYGG